MASDTLQSNVEKESPEGGTPAGNNEENKARPADGGTAKIFKSLPSQKIQQFKIGNKDSAGHVITDILAFGNEFVIYEIETNDINKKLNIYIDGFTDKREEKIINDYCEVKPKFIIARGLLYKSQNYGIKKNLIATALATALHGDPTKANEQFKKLIESINKEYEQANKSRIYYILPGYILLTFFTLTLGVDSYFNLTQNSKELKEIFQWMTFAYASVIGGVFSLTLSLPNTKFDTEINGVMFFVYGIERISISILAGIICVCGIRAQLVLPELSKEPINPWVLFFIVIIAAFSEKMIPNILGKISDKGK